MEQLISRQFEYWPEMVNSVCVCDREGGGREWGGGGGGGVDEVR